MLYRVDINGVHENVELFNTNPKDKIVAGFGLAMTVQEYQVNGEYVFLGHINKPTEIVTRTLYPPNNFFLVERTIITYLLLGIKTRREVITTTNLPEDQDNTVPEDQDNTVPNDVLSSANLVLRSIGSRILSMLKYNYYPERWISPQNLGKAIILKGRPSFIINLKTGKLKPIKKEGSISIDLKQFIIDRPNNQN